MSQLEWNGEWSREYSNWDETLRSKYLDDCPKGTFWIPYSHYLKMFKGTCIMIYSDKRAHYNIISAGTDMSNKPDWFYAFNLDQPLNCNEDAFGIMCE